MIEVLKATREQKEALEGLYGKGAELRFVEDALGNWVVNTIVLNDDDFKEIHDDLAKLEVIEYVPKIVDLNKIGK